MASLLSDALVALIQRIPQIAGWQSKLQMRGENGVKVDFKNGPDGAAAVISLIKSSQSEGRAIKDVRFNNTTHYLQVAYCDDPGEDDWVDKIEFTTCSGLSLSEFYSF